MPTPLDGFRLDEHGAEFFPSALTGLQVESLLKTLAGQPQDKAGIRLFGVEALAPILSSGGLLGGIAARRMVGEPRPVRALLFDKTSTTNWSLGWHQDRVVAVTERIEVEGFGPWTRKHGALHVAPPPEVFTRMTTLRVHLDPVPSTNSPLLIAPGSHRLGRIAETEVPAVVAKYGVVACIADQGDAWLYATPILHASEASREPLRRRVLQVDYAVDGLPGGLEWLGI